MKEYERYVVWLEYLDSERKRAHGRRVPLDTCVRSPTLEEVTQACRRLNLDPQPQRAFHPKAARRESGYVSVKKQGPKQAMLVAIARELSKIRGSQTKKV